MNKKIGTGAAEVCSSVYYYCPSCSVSVFGWGNGDLEWDLSTGEVKGDYESEPLFRCKVQPGERSDFFNVRGNVGAVVERRQTGEIVITFCLGGIIQGNIEVSLNGCAESGGMVLVLQHKFADLPMPHEPAPASLPKDPYEIEGAFSNRACVLSIDGKSGRIDWDCSYGVFWFHFNGEDFREFNSTVFSPSEVRTQNGFAVMYLPAGEFVRFRLTFGNDDHWLEITSFDTVRHSNHFVVDRAPVEL